MKTKTCTKCSRSLPASTDHFYSNREQLVARCKDCYREYQSKRSRTKEGKLSALKQRSKRLGEPRNSEFDLTDDFLASLAGLPCTYCEEPVRAGQLDRQENERGYTMDNCVPCCPYCNGMKSDRPEEEFLRRVFRIAYLFRREWLPDDLAQELGIVNLSDWDFEREE